MNIHNLTALYSNKGFKIVDNEHEIYKAGNSRTQSQVFYEPETPEVNPDLASIEEIRGYCSYVLDEIVKDSYEGKPVTMDIRLQPNLTLN